MRTALVGVVRSAQYVLRGLIQAGADLQLVASVPVTHLRQAAGMGEGYFADLAPEALASRIRFEELLTPEKAYDAVLQLAPEITYFVGWPYLVPGRVLSNTFAVGLHPSRLPERRGGAPLNWQLIDGLESTAASFIHLDEGVDSGDLITQTPLAIPPEAYISDVLELLYSALPTAAAKTHTRVLDPTFVPRVQDDSLATYTRRRTPEDGRLDPRLTALGFTRLVRAVARPFPGAYLHTSAGRLVVWEASIPRGIQSRATARPGEILTVDHGAMVMAVADYVVRIEDAELRSPESPAETSLVRIAQALGGEVPCGL